MIGETQVNRRVSEAIAANNNLSRYLASLQEGKPATPGSWLFANDTHSRVGDVKFAESIIYKWIPLMKSGNQKSRYGRVMSEFDLKQLEKIGPQGQIPSFKSEAVQQALEPIFSRSKFDSENALAKWNDVANEFGKRVFTNGGRARPLSIKRVLQEMNNSNKLNTNSGFPYFTKRKRVGSTEVQHAITGEAYEFPAIVLFRHYYGKLRPVWMFPMSVNLIESSYSIPIEAALRESALPWVRDYLSTWKGYEYVKQTLTRQWGKGEQLDGGDTTKMDAHMRLAQLKLVFNVVKWLFQRQYWPELWHSISYISQIPLLVGVGSQLPGPHGLASGSAWTQLTETVLQLLMAYNIRVIGQGIGDDFYWKSNLNAEQLVKYLAQFGLPANSSKQSVSDRELTFLQRLNISGFFSRENQNVLGGYYPTIRALNSLLWPERFHKPKDWSKDMFAIRCFAILENCVDDPCFPEFVQFVSKGHSYLKEFASLAPEKQDEEMRVARSIPGLVDAYNQEKLEKPLSSFVSLNLLR